jgi:F-type H+-transporting ATPase subunit b
MPQLDLATFPTQLFWLAITFIALLLLMAKVGLPRVDAAIEARRRRIDDDLARAAQMKTDAEGAIAAYQRTLAAARGQAQAAIKEATERLAAEAAERQRQLADLMAERTRAAEREIAAAKEQAFSEIRGVAVELAGSITQKLTGVAAAEVRVAAAVDRVFGERTA